MSVVKEDGGRLNAFAKEPEIQVINEKGTINKVSGIILIVGGLLVCGLIAISANLS